MHRCGDVLLSGGVDIEMQCNEGKKGWNINECNETEINVITYRSMWWKINQCNVMKFRFMWWNYRQMWWNINQRNMI